MTKLLNKLLIVFLVTASAFLSEPSRSQELEDRDLEICFSKLNYLDSRLLEVMFSKCLYSCINDYKECPDANSDPGEVCRNMLFYIQIVGINEFSSCSLRKLESGFNPHLNKGEYSVEPRPKEIKKVYDVDLSK